MLKILIVIGTRPEAIKMASVINSLKANKGINLEVCVTGQHRSMLDQVLVFFKINVDYDLDIMQANQTLNSTTGKIILSMDKVLDTSSPDILLVHGDTNTSFTAALAAFHKKIPIAHIEAGLRSGNIQLPFPEEGYRTLITKIASIHFAPTKQNVNNLLNEGVKKNNIIKTGNTVIDSLLYTAKSITGFSENVKNLLNEGVKKNNIIKTGNTVIDSLLYTAKSITGFSENIKNESLITCLQSGSKIILVTGHRRENLGQGLLNICTALKNIAKSNPDVTIIYPVHLNPRVKEPVTRLLGKQKNILLTDPLSYPDFVYLMKSSFLLLTDSGGIQEEGPSLGKPVLVMRDVTERPEAIEAGTVKLVGTSRIKIENTVQKLLNSPKHYAQMAKRTNPYGDGKAAARITNWLLKNASKIKKLKQV